MERKSELKFTDKNPPPVPLLKVGDRCYAHCPWNGGNYSHISVCEVRKVEVRWCEPSEYEKEKLGEVGHWYINYYIRTDVNSVGLKSTRMNAYHTGEDGCSLKTLYFTPQEALDENIRRFKEMVISKAKDIQKEMRCLGYSEKQCKNLLEYKNE